MWCMVDTQREATAAARRQSRCKSLLCCESTFSERREPAQLMPHQWPAELFDIVNSATARHLAEQPLNLPDLAAVIAESREAGQDRSVKARGCISQASPTLPSHVQAARRGNRN